MIINGEFDRLLLRPRGILLQVLCNEIDIVKVQAMVLKQQEEEKVFGDFRKEEQASLQEW